MTRAEELAQRLVAVRARLAAACVAADRPSDAARLVVVSKTWPLSDVLALRALGVRDLGENRDEEAATKAAALRAAERHPEQDDLGSALVAGSRPVWHFVGRVQSSKARSVASYADVVHSLDRPSLLSALARGAERAGRVVEVLVQVSLEDDEQAAAASGRGGATPDRVRRLADQVAGTDALRLAGVMAVAPLQADPDHAFARLAAVAAAVRGDHPSAVEISAGMSGDLEQAVAHGATLVRVGTALLGRRPPLLR